MPILTIQVQARELGRIRIGQVVATSTGKTRPSKLDSFRFTSHSRELLGEVSALYGGTVDEWQPQGGGAKAWELVTPVKRVPILVPPQPVSQWFELWSGGGCQRRCDGVTEQLSDQACMCSQEPEDRDCKPTTRLNVMLRDVPGLGVWRLESHGYYAAAELPAVAEFLAQANGYVPAALVLEERTSKRNGETRRYMVPAIEVEKVTPAQLMAGGGRVGPASIGAGAPAAIEAAGPSWAELIEGATTREELLGIRADAARAKVTQAEVVEIDTLLAARAKALSISSQPDDQPPAPPPDADALWMQILAKAPEGWTTGDVEIEFQRATGVDVADATTADMQTYLTGSVA
jgi:hypothetical protein